MPLRDFLRMFEGKALLWLSGDRFQEEGRVEEIKYLILKLNKIMQRISESDIKVTKDDQAQINHFSKLYQKRQELDEALVRLKEKISQHNDTLE